MIFIPLSSLRRLILLSCILVPLKSEALTPRFTGWTAEQEAWLDRAVSQFEPQLEPSVRGSFVLSKLVSGQHSNWSGDSNPGEIQLRWTDNPAVRESVLRHEMTHVWLAQLCGSKVGQVPVLSEVYAQFLSGDMNRLATGRSKFAYFSQAQAHLKKTSFAISPREQFEEALSRVLVQLEERPRQQLRAISKQLSQCRDLPKLQSEIESLLLNGNSLRADHRLRAHIDSLWINLESKETLFAEGRIDQPQPVGSTLKPFFVDRAIELLRPQVSHADWHCAGGPGRNWVWSEALSYSCNDYFLASTAKVPSAELSAIVGRSTGELSKAEMIGLIPTLKLSLRELAMVYSDLYERQSFVWPALQKTLTAGTLDGLSGRDEFIRWQSAAKTGTVQTSDGIVRIKYLVLYIPKGQSWRAANLLILRGEGVSEQALINHAHALLSKRPSPVTGEIQVSVLSLLRDQHLDLGCEKGPLQRMGETAKCLIGPLVVSTRTREGRPLKKRYFGSLTHRQPAKSFSPSREITERQALARRESDWVLRTSVRQYVAQTLISEAAGLQTETLRVLGPILLANALESESRGQPICDTTLCQVFNASPANRLQQERYLSVAEEVAQPSSPHEPHKFYLGGVEPWTKRYDLVAAKKALRVPELYSVTATGNQILVNGQALSCELMRASLHFLSCPAAISVRGDELIVTGRGEGHGEGLNLLEANRLALRGKSAEQIRNQLLGHADSQKYQ